MIRLNKLKFLMAKKGYDAVIITDRKNVFYYSGLMSTAGYLVVTADKNILVTDFRYIEQANMQAPNFTVVNVKDFDISDVICDGMTVGFENESIIYSEYEFFAKKTKNLKPLDKLLLMQRSIKEPKEAEYIQKAVDIADKAFNHILSYIKPDVSENDVALEIEYFMKKNGADGISFDTIVATGKRGSMPHAVPTDAKIKKGDFVVMDFGCMCNGYCSDMTRTVSVGNPKPDDIEVYNTVLKAQLTALDAIKEGISGCDAHKISEDIINQKYKGTFGHSLGHGVGLEIHEYPNLSPKNPIGLCEGNVVTVEPGIYIPSKLGVRIEDMGMVTKNGFLNFTKSPKELIVL